jgi:hypothetical protein
MVLIVKATVLAIMVIVVTMEDVVIMNITINIALKI